MTQLNVDIAPELHTKAKVILAGKKKTFVEFVEESIIELIDKEDKT